MTVCPHCNAAEGERHHDMCIVRAPGYAQDERRPPQPGYQPTKGDGFLSSGTTSRSDPRIYSPGGDTWAAKFKTEVAAHQDTLRALENKEHHRVINEQALTSALSERDEMAERLEDVTRKLDSHVRTIRALAVYRDFFELLQKVVPT